jgi:2-octaprenyl-6-methoxyphenol hydroxylase
VSSDAETADVVIVGGGPAGSALALALAQGASRAAPRRVVVLESRPVATTEYRPLALSRGSSLFLQRLGVWSQLSAAATPIRRIHVSQRGAFGRAQLEAGEAGVPALGYVVDYGLLSTVLAQAAAQVADYRSGLRVVDWSAGYPARLSADCEGRLLRMETPLLVIADGSGSADAEAVDYHQCALTAQVDAEGGCGDIAYERFTPEGPLALLPDRGQWALVWTVAPARAQHLCGLGDAEFLAELQLAFGQRAGRFTRVAHRASHPLQLRRAERQALPHAVLIGNAAQTLHPVAGQGFNLALRDAAALARQALDEPQDLGDARWTARYVAARASDRRAMVGFTHGLVRLFSSDIPVLSTARGAALTALGSLPPLKRWFARRMSFGLRG